MSNLTFTVKRNYRGELSAKTEVPTAKDGYILNILTTKDNKGISTYFQAGQKKVGENGSSDSFSFIMFQDFSKTINHNEKRATEKSIAKCHHDALTSIEHIQELLNKHYKINPVPAFS